MKVTLKEIKKLFTVRPDEPVIRHLKLLSVDLDRPISDLLAEAISDLVRKLGRTEVVYSTVATLLPHAITGRRGSTLL